MMSKELALTPFEVHRHFPARTEERVRDREREKYFISLLDYSLCGRKMNMRSTEE
jgi:hypothetical protein